MNYSKNKTTLQKIHDQVRSANWVLRAYFRAILRSQTTRQKGIAIRAVALLLSLLFFHYFPVLVLTSYMSWKGFFSYDMFKDGLSGATAFYWWAEAMLIVWSLYVAGSLFFIIESMMKRQKWSFFKSVWFWAVLTTNIIVLWTIFSSDWTRNDGFKKEHVAYTCLICAWIVIHITLIFNGQGKTVLRSLLAGIILLTSISFFQPGALALPYSLSLQFFGNGGNIQTTIQLIKNNESIHGRLVLNSPNHVYLYKDGSHSISVIANKDIELLTIDNLSGFGHK